MKVTLEESLNLDCRLPRPNVNQCRAQTQSAPAEITAAKATAASVAAISSSGRLDTKRKAV